ncbi:MAG: FkbM family methyltransferase [Pseudomonadota bacterium]
MAQRVSNPSLAKGIGRSLRLYYGDADRADRMAALYGHFLGPDSLAFDIGAHVGDRTLAFRRLGARVVAVEPQPMAHRALRLIHGRDAGVTLSRSAVGAAAGEAEMQINSANPTVSTLSSGFLASTKTAIGWEGQVWDRRETVPVVTLDALIAQHGRPDFIKIDVEGMEDAVLAGLSQPVKALSFEITTAHLTSGLRALERTSQLGQYVFAFSLGEALDPEATGWTDAAEMASHLRSLPEAANSGDVYARLVPAEPAR